MVIFNNRTAKYFLKHHEKTTDINILLHGN